MSRQNIFNLVLSLTLLLTILIIVVGIMPNAASAGRFSVGDAVEVYNTGSSGLLVRDAPCGNRIGGRFDGARGIVLDGPIQCDNYNRWLIRWDDELQGWSAEDWLKTAQTNQAPQQVTLTLYAHENTSNGPVIQGAQVSGNDGNGSYFSQITNSGGYVVINGAPGTWSFAVSKNGYDTNSWSQGITSTTEKHAYLIKQAPQQVDNTNPTVISFNVSPSSVNAGNSFTISCSVSDSGGSGLNRIELWRANDNSGSPVNWTEVKRNSASGNGQSTSFYDAPSAGSYWYGIHVVDNAGNWAPENSPVKVTVVLAIANDNPANLTVASVSFSPSSINIGESLTVNFTVLNQGGSPSGSFNNRISLATSQWGTTYSLGNYSMSSLAPGASQSVSITMNSISSSVPCPSSYYVTVFTDSSLQVSESNENNNIGSASSGMVNVNCQAPTTLLPVPSLGSPGNGQSGVCTSPTFRWSQVSGANRYWLIISSNQGSLPTNLNESSALGCTAIYTTETSYTVSGLTAGTTYYWEVQAFNDSVSPIRQGQFSIQYNFSTQSTTTELDNFPNVNSLDASKSEIELGDSVTLSFSVSDDVGLRQVELWRVYDDINTDFEKIKSFSISGKNYSGFFSDTPSSEGSYRYGIHVVDSAGEWNCERNSRTDFLPGVYGPKQIVVNRTVTVESSINVSSNLAGASFTLSGPSNYRDIVPWSTNNADVGSYTITWDYVSGYEIPPPETKTITDSSSISFYGNYQQIKPEEGEWQRNIKATREGTTDENQNLNSITAYGYSTDTDIFVALPCKGLKGRWIEIVCLQSGIKRTVPLGDIGPWYTEDCYWISNSRPRAESQSSTNKAGMDISQACWVNLGLNLKSGEVIVDWRFVDPPVADAQHCSLSTSISPSGTGSINPSNGTYDKDELVKLTASANSGWRFAHWSDIALGTSTTTTITMDCDKSITAYFIRPTSTIYHQNGWYWPLGRANTTTDVYWLDTRYWSGRDHLGHDFLGNAGDPVYAISHGIVVLSDAHVEGYGPGDSPGGALVIMHSTTEGITFYSLYGHLDNLIPVSKEVKAGTIVGYLNHYSPAHLHFGIHPDELDAEKNFRGFTTPRGGNTYEWVDPIDFLNNNQPSQPVSTQTVDQSPSESVSLSEAPNINLQWVLEIMGKIRNFLGFK